MCGIDAVMGKNAVLKALLITIGQIERGDKGTGIAFYKGKIKYLKEPISPVRFFAKHYSLIKELSNIEIAIAHNRQPSFGNVSYYNTHPFLSCKKEFALIHNGSIAIDNEIRKALMHDGHKIMGETDSEVITHILEEYLHLQNFDYVKALEDLVNHNLLGAIIVLTNKGEIYATKKGSWPLNFVKYKGEIYLASSSEAIRNLIRNNNVEFQSLKSKQILRVKTNRKIEVIGKGEEDYSTYLNKFINDNKNNTQSDLCKFLNENKEEPKEEEKPKWRYNPNIWYYDNNDWYVFP